MIASWVTQVSHTPPLILVAVHPNRYSHKLIDGSKCFALHVVDKRQTNILSRMKGPEPAAKFSGIQWEPGQTGSPILKHSMAWLECKVVDQYTPGNHTLFVGHVIDAHAGAIETPMCTLDYKGTYIGDA
jgi:flavin reductase (DIM6/NTAB) family NADH-FMN oxidoreductase RutF